MQVPYDIRTLGIIRPEDRAAIIEACHAAWRWEAESQVSDSPANGIDRILADKGFLYTETGNPADRDDVARGNAFEPTARASEVDVTWDQLQSVAEAARTASRVTLPGSWLNDGQWSKVGLNGIGEVSPDDVELILDLPSGFADELADALGQREPDDQPADYLDLDDITATVGLTAEARIRLEAEALSTLVGDPPDTLEDALAHPSHLARAAAFREALGRIDVPYRADNRSSRFGSQYVYLWNDVEDLPEDEDLDPDADFDVQPFIKVRFADHAQQSVNHDRADYNVHDDAPERGVQALLAVINDDRARPLIDRYEHQAAAAVEPLRIDPAASSAERKAATQGIAIDKLAVIVHATRDALAELQKRSAALSITDRQDRIQLDTGLKALQSEARSRGLKLEPMTVGNSQPRDRASHAAFKSRGGGIGD